MARTIHCSQQLGVHVPAGAQLCGKGCELRSGPNALVDAAVERLEAAIYAGEIAAGARVSEQALAQRFDIGRGAIREAVRTLEGRGLLERSQYAGTRVVNPSLDEVEQLLQTREALEGMASRLAAELMSLHETRALRACLGEHGKVVEADLQGGPFRQGTPWAPSPLKPASGWFAASRELLLLPGVHGPRT